VKYEPLRKFSLVILTTCLLTIAHCQLPYWQQQVNFNIDVTLRDKDNTLSAFEKIEYTNNSPDSLKFIWFHLWPNAYKNENTAYARQIFREKEGKKKWKDLKDKGWIDSLDFEVDGVKAKMEPDAENIDIAKLVLPSILPPGGKISISTPFVDHLPTYISRSGHLGQSYMICQWYPKPAVYDRKGWHPIPYLEMGEFYSEYGKFTVHITAPSNYVIAATGTMQEENELRHYKELGAQNLTSPKNKKYVPLTSQPTKTVSYHAENVHDFAWFADKDFIIEYDTMQLASGRSIDVFAYRPSNGSLLWDKSVDYIKDAVRHYSSWIGEYPYDVVQAVEGPKNLSAGGMEYPTITLITQPDADEENLDVTITHEVGHNWFYAIIGSNERDHAWMDEGINTYFQFRYEHEKYKNNVLFGGAIPENVKEAPLDQFEAAVYLALLKIPMESPIDLAAQDYRSDDDYEASVYIKAAIWMYMIEVKEGRTKLDNAFKEYFTKWKFRHPYPEDLQKVLEKSMGKSLDQYFLLLKQKGNLK
jgi:hypothetical protein